MDFILRRKIFNLIQFLFGNQLSEEHKNLLLSKYSNEDDIKIIVKKIMVDLYKAYYKEEDKLNFYLEYLSKNYLDNIEVKELQKEILEQLESNLELSYLSIQENNEEMKKTLLFICSELNKLDVDYYVVGSTPIYLKNNISVSRYHSDIDIAINSKDIKYLDNIFKNSNYYFIDNRLCSQKFFDFDEKRARGGHEILAQNKNNEFSIGFYEFDRLDDTSITKKDYFSELVDGKLINRVCKYKYSREFTDLYYSKDKINFENISFRYCTIEGIYLLKSKSCHNIGRNKDLFDLKVIEDNYQLDRTKLKNMQELLNESSNYIIEEIK